MDEGGLRRYLDDSANQLVLSRDEESALAVRARDGDAEARATLSGAGMRLVVAISRIAYGARG